MFGFFYDICLHLFALASLPKVVRKWAKYKTHLRQRLGKGFPRIDKGERQLIWIHAVSLGETKAVAPLVQKFKEGPNPPLILLTTATETGHAEGLKSAPQADYHLYLPLDFRYIIKPIVKQAKPDLVILTETDFWYHFQTAAKEVGAKLVLINGKISQQSFERLHKFSFLAKKLLAPFDHFYLQGELYKTRFAALGVPESKLTVTGNIKLDAPLELCDVATLKKELGLAHQPVLTLGSTHAPEEKIWLDALKQIWIHYPELKVFLVPRHPQRFESIAALLEQEDVPYARWSLGGSFEAAPVMLVDAMGVLRTCYQLSDLTFVGGSFTSKVGGHNILEPSFYGKPVLFGPYMHSQPDLLDLVLSSHAGLQITPEAIVPTVLSLLDNPAAAHALGKAGQTLTSTSRGALDLTFHALFPLLQKTRP